MGVSHVSHVVLWDLRKGETITAIYSKKRVWQNPSGISIDRHVDSSEFMLHLRKGDKVLLVIH